MAKPVNLAGVRAARDKAKAVKPTSPPPDDGDQVAEDGLPPDCPVRPLGKDGRVRYYLDADRQLVALPDRDHSRLGILALFGQRAELLYSYWPRHDKNGNVTGWRPELASENLMAACSRQGVWDAKERQRGRGAWLGEAGELVLHTGTHVMTFPATSNPYRDHTSDRAGLVGHYVYSAAAAVGMPSTEPAEAGPNGAADRLLAVLRSWNWRRGEMDAVLMLGWIGAAMIGGALKWRPMVWLTGGKGTGKSTLQDLLRAVFGGALIQTADTTSAGLYQTLRHQTLPIAVDELEAEEDNRRNTAVVRLARLAASGALMLRGGQDHAATEFVVRSSFLFSSILIPPLTGQDRSRISVLELDELQDDAPVPKIDGKVWGAVGNELRRRLVDGWQRLAGVLDQYRTALQEAGHAARAADQLGTLLAVADVLLADDLAPGDADVWVSKLNASELADAAENSRDEDRCLALLMSTPVDVFRGGARRSIGEWVRQAAGIEGDEEGDSQRVLGTYGLKLLQPTPANGEHGAWPMMLAVANYHKGLAPVFADSHWKGTAGTMGVWVQALRRLPGAVRPSKPLYFAGATSRAVAIPLSVVLPLESVPVQHHERLLRRP
jgi:hypothetical protein